ncbi:sensor histidine kinase [Sphingomonas sp. CARO-RG-8B-R24-01]|uniref:sensor histidine kinase n=1 Tax=Sphingomonas sp. CARO-RG-8B-R24-01 TaxID=2914831 RepID=UPI001F593C7F|nr:sensor histidine kinase [Sphingomonas sp. CARO-RG-8B-R24-01]
MMTAMWATLPGRAMAVDPVHTISQYGHRVWRIGDAGLETSPKGIAQTPDGQIWVGTTDGLYRFDGKQFTRWTPTPSSQVVLHDVVNLFAARNGDLYIGSQHGLYRIHAGNIFKYPNVVTEPGPFTEDRNGTVWLGKIGHHSDSSAFCSIGRTTLQCHGTRDGVPCWSDYGIAVGEASEIWAGGYSGICRWRPGKPTRVYPLGGVGAPVTAITYDARRALFAAVASGSTTTGLWSFAGNAWKHVGGPLLNSGHLNIWKLLTDQHGALWVGTHGQGLYRLAGERVDHFNRLDGLSGDSLSDLMQDREGSIWVVTPRGVDQFFDLPITRFTAREGLSGDAVRWLTPAPDGSILASNGAVINRISSTGMVSRFVDTPGGDRGGTVLADTAGRVWFGADAKLIMFDRKRGRRAIDQADKMVRAVFDMAEDAHHSVWAVVQDWKNPPWGWLWRFDHGRRVQRVVSPAETGHYSIFRVSSDLAGGLWVPVYQRGFYNVHDGIFTRISSLDAVASRPVLQILPVAPGEAWLATEKGLAWLKDGRTRVLTVSSGLPCDSLYGVAFDKAGGLWLTTQCDLVEIPAAELDRWRRQPGYRVHAALFGPGAGYVGDETSRLVRSDDGQLWFAGGLEAYRVDPERMPVNDLPPPVQVQRVAADQRPYAIAVRTVLPKLTHNLEIDYAGLSYLQPDLLNFRYRLFGHDRDWNDVGNRRAAFYNDLAPGSYRFQVTACNKDGVCNKRGASIILVIPPAWWQTWWFTMLWILAAIALVVAAVRWRLTAYAELTRIRFDDRLEERTRVARDLHDTLMQSVLASRLLAEGGKMIDTVPEGRAAFTRLSEWLGHAADEGRAAVDSLRSSTVETNRLADAFELAALEGQIGGTPAFHIDVTGELRALHPIARDEIHRIGVEAIRNARVHSAASHLRLTLDYAHNFTMRIRDDGHGVDEDVLKRGKAGHFGLVGMRERAEHIRGKLVISSTASGTEIALVVPGNVAYAGKPTFFESFGRLWRQGFRMPTRAFAAARDS